MIPRRHRIAIGLVALLALLATGGAITHGFVWDDRPLIVDNPMLRSADGVASLFASGFWQTGDHHDRFRAFYRPFVSLTYAVDGALYRMAPAGFHLTNLLLHLACALLVYALACRREPGVAAATLAAALFAVHPVHVESVAWISGRTDLLATLLVLAAFLLDRAGGRRDPAAGARRGAAFLAFLLALLSKEVAATLPILIGLDRIFRPGRLRTRMVIAARAAAPYLAILVAYLGLRRAVLGPEAGALYTLDPLSWAATALFVLARDATLLLLPVRLDPHYPYPVRAGFVDPVVVLSAVIVASIVIAAVRPARRSRRAGFAFAWIGVTLMPVLRFGSFGDVLLADRFLYLPSVGLALLAARAATTCAGSATIRFRRAALAAAAATLALFTALAARQTRLWHDDLMLWSTLVGSSPASAMVHSNLGLALYGAGRYDQAIAEYKTALALLPEYAMAHNNLAAVLDRVGRQEEASAHYAEALRLAPRQLEAQVNLANLRARTGDGLALDRLRLLAMVNPKSARARLA
ncbi:MAG TPA: tetratricopeptide repeat protein, partial [Dongiaceae bacterium]|nr:tetratricopeptide repeat protein [Dongiaceae bacterium]